MSGRYDDAMYRVHELERENAALLQRLEDWGRVTKPHDPTKEGAKLLAESEYAALRAEVERLQTVLSDVNAHALAKMQERNAAESRLAAANALLIRCQQAVSPVSLLGRDLDVHLTAQPATAPARTDAESELAQLRGRVEDLNKTFEYCVKCEYVSHAGVRWLRSRIQELSRRSIEAELEQLHAEMKR